MRPISAHAPSTPKFSDLSFSLLARIVSRPDRKFDRFGNAHLELLPYVRLFDHICLFWMGQISIQKIWSESSGKQPSRARVNWGKPWKPSRPALFSPQKLEESLSTDLLGNRLSTDSDHHHHRLEAIKEKSAISENQLLRI